MKRLFLLMALSLISVLGMAQDFQTDIADEIPSFKRWGCIVDFERNSSVVNMYNLTGIYGINFAGGHLFLGAGLAASYMHSPDQKFSYVAKRWVDGHEERENVTKMEEYGVNKGLLSLAVDMRYQILTKYRCSPIFQWRVCNAFASGDSYFSHNTGFCYNLKGSSQLEFTVGFLAVSYKRDYVHSQSDYDYDVLLNLSAGFKF